MKRVSLGFFNKNNMGELSAAATTDLSFMEMYAMNMINTVVNGYITVAGVDQIYVIEDGQITESGKSRELLEKGGVFSHMWQDYQTSVQWKVAKEVQ